MALGDFIQVTVSVSAAPTITKVGFGTPMVAGYFTHWSDRVRVYAASTALAAMVLDGFTVFESTYKAVAVLLEQDPTVGQVYVGRRALKPQQAISVTYTDATAGDVIAFTLGGSDGSTHVISLTASGTPATDATAAAALVAAISGHATIFGTSSATGAVLSFARTDGLLTDLSLWHPTLTIADATTDPGVATDLAAITAANTSAWYGFTLESNSLAEIEAAAAWAEGTGVGGKFYTWNNSDTICQTSSTSDVISALKALNYRRDTGWYNGKQLLCHMGAAMLGLMLPFNPGSAAWGFKTPTGVLADDDVSLPEAGALIINSMTAANPGPGGKKGNYFKTQGGVDVTFPGCTPSGEWADVTIFADWVQVFTQADVFALIVAAPKLPYTDFGIGQMGNAIRNRLKIGASPAYNGIDGTQPIVVNVPKVSTIDATDKVARNLPGLTASAALSGAILTTGIAITLVE